VPGPPKGPGGIGYSDAEVATAIADSDLSGSDGDRKKTIAEYWADGPGTEFPPGHTAVFAQAVSRKKFMNSTNSNAKLDYDAKLFFMVGNAMMDSSIASWWLKFYYDFWRPTTAIRYLYNSTRTPTPPLVKSWLGPGLDYDLVEGEKWIPYQALNVVTPPFPEYPSGHSTFTAAGASLLALFNGSDAFGASVIISDDETPIEPGTPAAPVTLSWPTFSDASAEAGMSRRYGGIHFYSGDMHGRGVGRQVANYVYSKAQNFIKGYTGK
jgi:PAP2 superfamily